MEVLSCVETCYYSDGTMLGVIRVQAYFLHFYTSRCLAVWVMLYVVVDCHGRVKFP